LGRIHARLLSQRTDVELAGIVEPLAAARETASREFGTPGVAEFHSLPRAIDAAIVATPTASHHDVTMRLSARARMCWWKNRSRRPPSRRRKWSIWRPSATRLQVGHVERFDPRSARFAPS
jgi:hypothetical protein